MEIVSKATRAGKKCILGEADFITQYPEAAAALSSSEAETLWQTGVLAMYLEGSLHVSPAPVLVGEVWDPAHLDIILCLMSQLTHYPSTPLCTAAQCHFQFLT